MFKVLWKPDSDAINCCNCQRSFNIFLRKHHCRACGEIFCKRCLPTKIICIGYSSPELACVKCVGTSTTTALSSNNQKKDEGTPTRTSSYDVAKIQALCETFKPSSSDGGRNYISIAQLLVEQAQPIVPAPFNGVCVIASTLLSYANNAVINSAEANRLANRVSYLSYAILQLVCDPGNFDGAKIIADQMLTIFDDAVSLLEKFQPDTRDRSFIDMIKKKFTLYSSDAADDFASIHESLTMIMQDRLFVASIAKEKELASAPTLSQIQEGIKREVTHILETVKKSEQDDGIRLEHIESQLSSVMTSLSAAIPLNLQSKDIITLDPFAVHIDTSKVLGKGASGFVFGGYLYGSTPVAVKVLLNSPATEEILREVKHEMERTIRVAHRNVIKIYGLLVSCPEFEGRAAVVMERLGCSLDKLPARPSHAAAMKLTGDIIAGMARVHDSDDGLVHFDLKLENILLTMDGRTAKIVDFGVAQTKTTVAFATHTETAKARGTVAYMAPEILLGTSRGFYCDVYSFGTVLYALWSGKKPWQGFSDATIITAVQQGSRPSTDLEMISQGIPESIVALITSCWDHSPGNRPTFKNMMPIRDIDAFWEAPMTRWPLFLQQHAANRRISDLNPTTSFQSSLSSGIKGTMSTNSQSGSFATTTTSSTLQSFIGGASVVSFNSEQLCSWLTIEQNIEQGIVEWMLSKKINGDIFASSGMKIIQKLRDSGKYEEWHIDSLERCHQRIVKIVEQEESRQKQLAAARQAVTDAARQKQLDEERSRQAIELAEKEKEEKHLAQEQEEKLRFEAIEAIKREEAAKRAIALARAAEYEKCREKNMQAVNAWYQIWTTKNPEYIEGIYRNHYSQSWSGTMTVLGKTTSGNDLEKAKAHSYASLKQDWTFLEASFKILESTDTHVQFTYSTTTPTSGNWTANARFDFDPPGLILRSNFVISKA